MYAQIAVDKNRMQDSYYDYDTPADDAARIIVRGYLDGGHSFESAIERARAEVQKQRGYYREGTIAYDRQQKILDALDEVTEEAARKERSKHLYEVEIPDDNGKNYLDWEGEVTKEQYPMWYEAMRKLGEADNYVDPEQLTMTRT